MADITMCTQTLCPNAGHCYRVQATQSSDWQSMMTFPYTVSVRGVECDNYMPMYRTVVADSTVHNAQVQAGPAGFMAGIAPGTESYWRKHEDTD